MLKYKEIRILGVIFVVIVGTIYELVQGIIIHDKAKIILGALILFSALWMTIGKYNSKVGEDYLLIYEFKLIGILPSLVEFKDIESLSATKHIVTIKHKKRTSKVYMVDAISFEKEYQEKTALEK